MFAVVPCVSRRIKPTNHLFDVILSHIDPFLKVVLKVLVVETMHLNFTECGRMTTSYAKSRANRAGFSGISSMLQILLVGESWCLRRISALSSVPCSVAKKVLACSVHGMPLGPENEDPVRGVSST